MRSDDVLHSMFIPVFRVKMDVVPGRYTDLWFEAKQVGTFKLLCAEFCGKGHSDMVRNVYVYAKEEFSGKLENLNPLKGLSDEQYAEYKADPQKFIEGHPEVTNLLSPAEMGARVYEKKGCRACHSVDGKAGTGPTFLGLWGRQERITDGPSVVVDENYVRESIVDPNAKIVEGFRAQMSSYQGKITDRQIDALIAYFKTLKKRP
jgi:cytochrome c oxidase subunit 2